MPSGRQTRPDSRSRTYACRRGWATSFAVRSNGPWKRVDDLEIATAEYIDWFDHRRLHGEIGLTPPVEHEDNHYRHNNALTTVDASVARLH